MSQLYLRDNETKLFLCFHKLSQFALPLYCVLNNYYEISFKNPKERQKLKNNKKLIAKFKNDKLKENLDLILFFQLTKTKSPIHNKYKYSHYCAQFFPQFTYRKRLS